jgi:hypothetical protein
MNSFRPLAGLDPVIHVLNSSMPANEDVDPRVKSAGGEVFYQ